jgi:hypothetical protein
MNALRLIDLVNESSEMKFRRQEIQIFVQCDFFFLDRADDTLGLAVLFCFADSLHTDLDLARLEHLDVLGRGIRHTLLRMVDAGCALHRARSSAASVSSTPSPRASDQPRMLRVKTSSKMAR